MLDNTGVHPESYEAAEKLLSLFGYTDADVLSGGLSSLSRKIKLYGVEKAAAQCGTGVPTLTEHHRSFEKPGRDIRDALPQPMLRSDIMSLSDLTPGMTLTGTVRNVIDFGVFVDMGVHQDGLVHISQLCNKYIKHPSEVVKVGDIVKVRVLSVDAAKKIISLTMKD